MCRPVGRHLLVLTVVASALIVAGSTTVVGDSAIPGWDGDEQGINGSVELIVETAPERHAPGEGPATRRTAAPSGTPLETHAAQSPGLAIERRFSVGNATLVSVDPDRYDVRTLAGLDGVNRFYPNVELHPQHSHTEATREGNRSTTYGLERINATALWNTSNTGVNATVAVIDTGVDASHPDIDLPPDGWAHFANDGSRTNESPHDPDGHGTHVSGTIVGDHLPSGAAYGVAPNATLLHAGVQENGSMTIAAVFGALEWVMQHDRDVDVISLSIGGGSIGWLDPIQAAREAGILVVAASGNDGPGTSVAPANSYDSLSVGATDETGAIARFSSSELVSVREEWGIVAPPAWPDHYGVPAVTAPGVDVCSSVVGGGYECSWSGTSMATPHVAGVAALLVSADPTRTGDDLSLALRNSARRPAGGDPLRHGAGTVDAWRANRTQVTSIIGTVSNASGSPLENVAVRSDRGPVTTTDENGTFHLTTLPGSQTLTVEKIGYHLIERTVSPTVATPVNVTVTLANRSPDGAIVEVPDDHLTAGWSTRIGVRLGQVDAIRVVPTNESTLTEEAVSMRVNGTPVALGELYQFDSRIGAQSLPIDLETDPDAFGTVELRLELVGSGANVTLPVDPIAVHPAPITVAPTGGDTDSIQSALDVAAPGTTIEVESGTYVEGPTPNGSLLTVQTPVTLTGVSESRPTVTPASGVQTGIHVHQPAVLDGLAIDANGLESGLVTAGNATATVGNTSIDGPGTGVTVTANATASIDRGTVSAGTGITVNGSLDIVNSSLHTTGPRGMKVAETGTVGAISNVSIRGTNGATQVGISANAPINSIGDTDIQNVSTGLDLQSHSFGITNLTVAGELLERGLVLNGTVVFGLTETTIRANTSTGTGVVLESDARAAISRLDVTRGAVGVDSATNDTSVSQSDFSGVRTAIVQRAGTIAAQLNYYGGEPRATNRTLVGPVRYGPFVTAQEDSQSPADAVTNFAYHLGISPAGPQAFSVPGGSNRTLEQMLGPMDGVLWEYDDNRWRTVTDLDRRPAPLEAFILRTTGSGTITVEPNASATITRPLEPGWTLLGSPTYSPAKTAFGSTNHSLLVLNRFEPPAGDPGWDLSTFSDSWEHAVLSEAPGQPKPVSAHGGYFLYTHEPDTLESLAAGNHTVESYIQAAEAPHLGSMAETAPLEHAP